LEGSTSEKTAAGTLPAISGKRNEPNIQIDIAPKQKAFPLLCFYCFFYFFIAGIELNFNTILNTLSFNLNIEEQFAKDDEIIVSKSQPSPIASQFPSMLSKGIFS
jgi:hypothetical protein